MKRIIWIASDKKHHSICDVWYNGKYEKFSQWKKSFSSKYYYITKHEVWL